MDSRSFVARFRVSPKHWLGPVGHLRVSLSSSSRKFFKMCREIEHVKIRILYSIPPINSNIKVYRCSLVWFCFGAVLAQSTGLVLNCDTVWSFVYYESCLQLPRSCLQLGGMSMLLMVSMALVVALVRALVALMVAHG